MVKRVVKTVAKVAQKALYVVGKIPGVGKFLCKVSQKASVNDQTEGSLMERDGFCEAARDICKRMATCGTLEYKQFGDYPQEYREQMKAQAPCARECIKQRDNICQGKVEDVVRVDNLLRQVISDIRFDIGMKIIPFSESDTAFDMAMKKAPAAKSDFANLAKHKWRDLCVPTEIPKCSAPKLDVYQTPSNLYTTSKGAGYGPWPCKLRDAPCHP